MQPILARTCYKCHGEKRQKGDVRLDTLDPDIASGNDADTWHHALEMIESGEMPPERSRQLSEEDRRTLVGWLRDSLDAAAEHRRRHAPAVLRRLTRAQYANSLRDLLELDIDFGRTLPEDGKSKRGFSNDGATLLASSLHLETFRQIAREALDRAIAPAERPEVTRYRVDFGTGIGKGKVAARTGGYQSVPLGTNDFAIELLGDHASLSKKKQDAIRRKMSIGLRGSDRERFQVVDEGIVLFSAVPHIEIAPGAWQGPSPNVKLEMQRVFPRHGDFVMRVRASRGYIPPLRKQLLVALDAKEDFVHLDDALLGDSARIVVSEHSIVLPAGDAEKPTNLVLEGEYLRPKNVPLPASAKFRIAVPEDGFYQIDVVHRVVQSAQMPQIRVTALGATHDVRPVPPARLAAPRVPCAPMLDLSPGYSPLAVDESGCIPTMVTSVCAAGMRRGTQVLEVGGPFFTGFRALVVTKLPATNALVRRLEADVAELTTKVQDAAPSIRAYVGTRTDDGMDYATFDEPKTVDAPLGHAETYEFRGRLENLPIPEPESGDTEPLSGFMLLGLWNDTLVPTRDETGPPLLVESIEFEAPYHELWPPRSHMRIFLERGSDETEGDYSGRVIARFLERAFRRSVGTDELDRYFTFWSRVRPTVETNEDAIREVLIAALTSPSFLFLVDPLSESESDSSDQALASRLSYFLWNSPPDERLLELAQSGALRTSLDAEVDRMLDAPKVDRFLRTFVHEWLRLDRFEQMTVDPTAFPRFTRFVKRDMLEETYLFVHEVLRTNAPVDTLIDADFTMLNENLARFYGIPGVRGVAFRRVELPEGSGRGGLLSHGSFLTGHSDGLEPHPIKRAVWLRKQLLDDPPPPPPPNVPELDKTAPDFDKLTLKQKIERHRDSDSCRDCHKGLDPYGIAFERFNAVGLFEPQRKGQDIDATTTLPDGTDIDGVAQLKAWLLAVKKDEVLRGLTRNLFAWAHGRDVTFADDQEVAAILERVTSQGRGLRDLVHAIVATSSFQNGR
ncbi:MAG: DUF1592 domain-containing protein [Planctomycetes bacterium]|nr:DUF1592 domain-containing protein [Planctomycetota bacterium]MCB9920319.1 DUF1592 domain-containing protein [Planctomycetota bacterium]